jgi:hypothetical protein
MASTRKLDNITPEIVRHIMHLYSQLSVAQKDVIKYGAERDLTETQVRNIIKMNIPAGYYTLVTKEVVDKVTARHRPYFSRASKTGRIQKSKSVETPVDRVHLMEECLAAYEAYQQAKRRAIKAGADEESLHAWLQLSAELFNDA